MCHGERVTDFKDLTQWSTSRLLRFYLAILEELLRRGVIRLIPIHGVVAV